MPRLSITLLLLAASIPPSAGAQDGDGITVYRCTDVDGRVELRDTPCGKRMHQQRRQMVRPQDPPPRQPAAPPASAPPSAAPIMPATQVIVVAPLRPLYECITPDGQRYTSDSGEGNPRWQPLWTLGYPVTVESATSDSAFSLHYRDRHTDLHYQSGGPHGRATVPTIAAHGAGTWVRDACHALPPEDVCTRLRERRDELSRRFFNAQPSERARLDQEQRRLKARLASDCGGR